MKVSASVLPFFQRGGIISEREIMPSNMFPMNNEQEKHSAVATCTLQTSRQTQGQ
jgi:hypothetical protein